MIQVGEYIEDPSRLPYVAEHIELQGRAIHVIPYFSSKNGEWFGFVQPQGKPLQRIALVDVVSGAYLASAPIQRDTDLYLPLEDLVFQRMSFPGVARPLMGLEDVVENFASLLELYELVSQLCHKEHPGAWQMAQLLVNQLFVVSRSLFDVLQGLCRQVCSVVKRLDDRSKRLMQDLPASFADAALCGEEPKTPRPVDEISSRYDMPKPIAEFYNSQASFLSSIRKVRDGVIHRGHNAGFVLSLDEGLAVPTREVPWKDLEIWDESSVTINGLGSLRRLFAYVVSQSVTATTRFAEAFVSCIALPEPMSPRNHVFLRGLLNHHLIKIEDKLKAPWERS